MKNPPECVMHPHTSQRIAFSCMFCLQIAHCFKLSESESKRPDGA